jgi:hypothetical protein
MDAFLRLISPLIFLFGIFWPFLIFAALAVIGSWIKKRIKQRRSRAEL